MAMKSVCMVYVVPFHRLLEAVQQSGEDIGEGTYAVICHRGIMVLGLRSSQIRSMIG